MAEATTMVSSPVIQVIIIKKERNKTEVESYGNSLPQTNGNVRGNSEEMQ